MRTRAVIVCCVPSVLLALDFAVLTVVVPAAGADLALSDAEVRWLFVAYSLAFGCLLLAAGRAADRLGRRRLLLVGLAIFAVGAGMLAVAATGEVAIGGRTIAGAGAATMTPAALSLLTATTRERDRSGVLAAYGLAISTGFVVGTLVAGTVATLVSWRVAVTALVPLAAAAWAAAWGILDRDAPTVSEAPGSFRVAAASGLVALAALGAAHGSMPGVAVAFAASVSLIAVTARSERMSVACSAGLIVTGTATAATLLLTLHLQNARGYSPLEASLVFTCFGVAAIPGAALARRMRPGCAVPTGLAVQGLGLLLAVPAADTSLLISVVGFGFGHVIGNASVAAVATAGAPAPRHGAIIGMLITAQYLGGALGPSLLGRATFQTGMALAGSIAILAAGATWWADAAP